MTHTDHSVSSRAAANTNAVDALSAFGVLGAIWRNKWWIIIPVALAAIGSILFVLLETPRYAANVQILVERQETSFTRPERESADAGDQLDREAVASEVQVIQSVEIARRVIREEGLAQLAEFNPALGSPGLISTIKGLIGLGGGDEARDPEQLILLKFRSHLNVYALPESRVIEIAFWSQDPELAARIANAVADSYIDFQKAAILDTTTEATTWLERQIADLRQKVSASEQKVEAFRSENNLFTSTSGGTRAGDRPVTLTGQQLSELSSQLTQARAQRSDAQARARLINELLESGRVIESRDVFASALIQRLQEERSRVRAQIAELSSTLLPAHPRMQELSAQRQNIERQIRTEARRIVRGLENDAAVAAAREQQINASLDALKQNATTSNEAEVQLRALEREANAQRQLLESYLTRFREAAGRSATELTPPQARIISRATVPPNAFYPSKKMIPLLAVVGTTILATSLVLTVELARLYAHQPAPVAHGGPAAPATPAMSHDRPVRREPGFVPQNAVGHRFESDPVEEVSAHAHEVPPVAEQVFLASDAGDAQRAWDNAPSSKQDTPSSDEDLQPKKGAAPWRPKENDQLVMIAAASRDGTGLDALIARARDISDEGRQVLAIDLRPGAPLMRQATGSSAVPGFHDIQHGNATFDETIFGDVLSRMNVMGAGQSVLASDLSGAEPLFRALTTAYDLVVLIAPPLNRAPWHIGLSRFCDSVALAAARSDMSMPDARRLVKRLENDGATRVELFVDGALNAAA